MSYYEIWDLPLDARGSFKVTRSGAQIGDDVSDKLATAQLIFDHADGRWRSVTVIDRTGIEPIVDHDVLRRLQTA
jgi:hypothetical protein